MIFLKACTAPLETRGRQPSTSWYAVMQLYMRASVTVGLDPACSKTPSLVPRQQLMQRVILVSGIDDKPPCAI